MPQLESEVSLAKPATPKPQSLKNVPNGENQMVVADHSSSTATPESLIADGWQPLDSGSFIEIVGQIYFKGDGDSIRYGFITEPRHRNRRGVLHGGVLAAFADRTLALAGRRVNDDLPQATIELSIRFVDAVHEGELVEAVPEVVRKTRSIIFVRGTLLAGSRIVATADGVWKILKTRVIGRADKRGNALPAETLRT